MEVEGGDGIKGLTRLGWHTLLRRVVLPGLSAHSERVHARLRDEFLCDNVGIGFVRVTVGRTCSGADIGAAVQ